MFLLLLWFFPWCPWPESNQHSLRNSILSRARLPVPPQGHSRVLVAGRPLGRRSGRNIAGGDRGSTRAEVISGGSTAQVRDITKFTDLFTGTHGRDVTNI